MSQPHLTTISSLSWLSKLKATQLHRIAVATGVQSSGTKTVIAQRLSDELQSSYNDGICNSSKRTQVGKGTGEAIDDDGKAMSILSIDMGIRNLAYAHIIVPPRRDAKLSDGKMAGSGKEEETGFSSPILNAWTRLAVSSFPTPSTSRDTNSSLNEPTPAGEKSQQTLSEKQVDALASGQNIEAKESFSPDLYASHAYSLITSLLATYKPTHILIERQRFRSGGSSAVLEWTIRVGVFEGMLYAVLNTLRREGRIKGLVGAESDVDVVVQGVEPKRVATYWTEGSLDSPSREIGEKIEENEEGNVKEKKSGKTSRAKDVKKAKINLVANWWLSLLERQDSGTSDQEVLKISLAEDSQARDVVDAYLRKWKGANSNSERARGGFGKKKKGSTTENSKEDQPVAKIKKLDDLADCLLQGIAWLEWREMRRRIARDGLQAMPWLQDSGSGKPSEDDDTKVKPARKRRTRKEKELK